MWLEFHRIWEKYFSSSVVGSIFFPSFHISGKKIGEVSHSQRLFLKISFPACFYIKCFKPFFLNCIPLKTPSETLENSGCCVWLRSNKCNKIFTFFTGSLRRKKHFKAEQQEQEKEKTTAKIMIKRKHKGNLFQSKCLCTVE